MYDHLTEWGPARHREDEATRSRPEAERRAPALVGAPDPRDAGEWRPDDN